VANFGHIPYGQKIIAPVILAEPFDGCSNNLTLPGFNPNNRPFVLVKRGNCTFVKLYLLIINKYLFIMTKKTTKANNAEKAGARMVIIEDNSIGNNYIQMADDGMGRANMIPAIFISSYDGYILKNFIDEELVKNQGNHSKIHHPLLIIEF
jgi:hypothetical protein